MTNMTIMMTAMIKIMIKIMIKTTYDQNHDENHNENHVNYVIQAVPCALMIDIAASVGNLTKYLFKNTKLSLSCV